jgi:hypothetical protein
MPRKSKDKEIPLDEALKMIRRELAPFWYGSEPLFAGVNDAAGARLFPIAPQFPDRNYLLLLTDLSCASSNQAISDFQHFLERFAQHELNFVLCLKAAYSFQLSSKYLELASKRGHWKFMVCLDADGAVASALGASAMPFAALIEKGRIIKSSGKPTWSTELEPLIHQILRSNDPGLALPLLYKSSAGSCVDAGGYDFGSTVSPDVEISGEWTLKGDLRITKDPKAFIRFRLPGNGLSVIAQSMDETFASAEILVEVNGQLVREAWTGPDLLRDELAPSTLRVGQPGSLRALEKVTESRAQVTLRFHHAHRTPVGIYGVRFHKSS